MAQRIAPLSAPVASPRSRETRPRLASVIERERARFTADPRLFTWRVCWSPIWLGSNGPSPRPGQRTRRDRASRGAALPAKAPGAGGFIQSNLDRLAVRLWLSLLAGSVLRGLWLGLLLATGWVLLTLTGLAGLPPVAAIVTLAGVGAIAGAAYGVLHRIQASTVAVMLDRTFGLDERLTTANGHQPRNGEPIGPVLPRLQLADAANALGEVMHELPRTVFFPVREAIALLVVAMALLTGLFAYVPDQPLPGLADAPVPRFVPASERLANPQAGDRPLATSPEQPAPSASDVQQQAQAAQQTREDLGVLGEALQDHPITQPASDAIAAGDYGAASGMIRSAASQAPNASEEERAALADDLDAAADQVAPSNPDLADASREAADDLRQGGPESGKGLEGLADSVDESAGAVGPETREPQESQSGEQGASGGAQPGVPGQISESGNDGREVQQAGSGADQRSSSAAGQSQQPAGDPGEGVAAAPGVANEEIQEPSASGEEAGEMSGAASSGQSQSGAGGAPDPNATDGAPGSDGAGQQPPSGEGASAEGGDPASEPGSQGLIGAPDDETSASQGSGAGTGQSGANDQTQGDQEVGDPAAPGEGGAVDPPEVGEVGDPPPGNGGGAGSAGEIGESPGTNDLSLQGTSDEGVRTGGSSGSSSTGSGTGSGAASGDHVQQQVGVAGPDANRIPDGMQDVVEDFFTEQGTGP